MTNKRSDLATILRRLADYVDRHTDEDLAPIFSQAATLIQTANHHKNHQDHSMEEFATQDAREIAAKLLTLRSREDGDTLLQAKAPNRRSLESLARFLQLPVQRDDTTNRLRSKIVENTIGSRLRSQAIQG